MKTKTRFLAMVLTVLTVLGLFPFAIFAVDTGSDVNMVQYPEKSTSKPIEEIKEAVGDNMVFYTSFDTITARGEKTLGGGWVGAPDLGGYMAPGGSLFTKDAQGERSAKIAVDDGNGGKAVKIQFAKNGKDTYSDIIRAGNKDLAITELGETRGKSFVFEIDVKGSEKIKGGGFITVSTRVVGEGYPWGLSKNIVSLGSKGEIYAFGNSKPVGYLNSESFVNIAAHVVPSENKFYIYTNGVNVNPEGFTFLSAEELKAVAGVWSAGEVTFTSKETDFILNHVRLYQAKGCDYMTNDVTIDNIRLYLSDKYEGTTTANPDGYVENGGKVYRTFNNTKVANTWLDGYEYGPDGAIVGIKERVPVVDFEAQYAGLNNDQISNGVKFGTHLIRNNRKIPGINLYEFREVKYNDKLAFVPKFKDFSGYNSIEFVVYTDGLQQIPIQLALNSDGKSPDGSGGAYWGKLITFGDKAYKGYNSKGSEKSYAPLKFAINGWGSGEIPLSEFSKGRPWTNWTDINKINLYTAGWELDYPFTSDLTTRQYNNGTETIYFAGINLVKYAPYSKPSDVLGEIVNGVQLAKQGDGWVGDFFYSPWDGKLVKDCTIALNPETVYTFDKNGVGKLANGYAVIDGMDIYCQNGKIVKDDLVTSEGQLIIAPDGRVLGIKGVNYSSYSQAAPYVNKPHTVEESKILYKADFNKFTPGVMKTARGGGGITNYAYATGHMDFIPKGTDIKILDRGEGNRAAGYYYETPNVDPYVNTWIDIERTLNKKIVIDVDMMITKEWNTKLNALQVIKRGSSTIFNGLLALTREGELVTANGNKFITIMPRDEFVRISAVLDTSTQTADYYVNGVKLFTGDKLRNGLDSFKEVRACQISANVGGFGGVFIDDLYVYEADVPNYVAENVKLKNGYVTEDDNVTRYYENGIPVASKNITFSDFGGYEALVENGGKLVYTDTVAPVVYETSLRNFEVRIPEFDSSEYDYVEFNMYLSETPDVDFKINAGLLERFYEVEGWDGSTGYLTGEYTNSWPQGQKKLNKWVELSTKDGSLKVNGDIRQAGDKYYLRIWDYGTLKTDCLKNLKTGWNNIRIPLNRKSIEFVSLTMTGWGLNADKPWNTVGKDNQYHPDAENIVVRLTDFKLAKGNTELFLGDRVKVNEKGEFGWLNEGENKIYIDPVTKEIATGVKIVDGLYYVFDENGISKGLANGIVPTKILVKPAVSLFSLTPSGLVEVVVNRYYENGVLKTGNFNVGEKICVADTDTGAIKFNDEIADVDGKFYDFDAEGLGTVANGTLEGVLYEDGVKAQGERTVGGETIYYSEGVPGAGKVMKTVGDKRLMYIYGDDGKFVEAIEISPKDITIRILIDGSELASVTFGYDFGKQFTYVPKLREGKTYVIVDKDGNEIGETIDTQVKDNLDYTIKFTTNP